MQSGVRIEVEKRNGSAGNLRMGSRSFFMRTLMQRKDATKAALGAASRGSKLPYSITHGRGKENAAKAARVRRGEQGKINLSYSITHGDAEERCR